MVDAVLSDLWPILILALLAGLGYLWWSGMKVRELAIKHARVHCRQLDLQFLDQTVALAHITLSRNDHGQRRIRRTYRFDCTIDGTHRDEGDIVMCGNELISIYLPYTRDETGNRIFIH